MATIHRPNRIHHGEQVKILQWANNWFTVEGAGQRVMNPSSLVLDADEVKMVMTAYEEGDVGTVRLLDMYYQLDPLTGRFKKRRRG